MQRMIQCAARHRWHDFAYSKQIYELQICLENEQSKLHVKTKPKSQKY